MKKILFLILFLTGLFPVFNNNALHLGIYQSYGQENTYGEDENGDLIICSGTPTRGNLIEETERDFRYEECYLQYAEAIKDCEEICGVLIEQKPDDCAGVPGGSAYEDSCGCIGGTTGILDCGSTDCDGVAGGTAYIDSCGCIGGTTGIDSCDPEPTTDCAGVEGGSAYMADCGCIGGTTGISTCDSNPPNTCTLVACSTGYVVDRNLCRCVPSDPPPQNNDDCDTSGQDLKDAFGGNITILNQVTNAINKYANKLGIDKEIELQHFLAQAAHESSGFTSTKEGLAHQTKTAMGLFGKLFNNIGHENEIPGRKNLADFGTYTKNGKVYISNQEAYFNYIYLDANRKKVGYSPIGNTSQGDGYKYIGRGIIQITGKENYSLFNTWYQQNVDSSVNLVDNPNLIDTNKEIGTLASLWYFKKKVIDRLGGINENTSVKDVTGKINAALEKLSEREKLFNTAKTTINCNQL